MLAKRLFFRILFQRQSSSITLVGFSSNFNRKFNSISNFLRTGEAEIEHRVDMTFSQTMFFSDFRNQIGADDKIPDAVEWEAEPGGICLKGEPSQVEKGSILLLDKPFHLA